MATAGDKPVIVRVKRKASQSSLDAFWLEINERPYKRSLLDFEKLSISESSSSRAVVEELNSRKILVRHVETVSTSQESYDVLCSFVPSSSGGLKAKVEDRERRHGIKTVNKLDQLLFKAKQKQEVLSRTARFEQIWRSRKVNNEAPEAEAIHEMCRLYDVVRVDVDEHKAEAQRDQDLKESKMMAQYLPLLRDVLPTAAEEIENDIHDCLSKKDGFVYDLYAVEDVNEDETHAAELPLVQVEDDDFYDGPDDSDYETDDSNAEDHPLNDYPDEELSEDDVENESSDENSENESENSFGNSSEELERESHQSLEYDDDDSGGRYHLHDEDEVFEELYGDEDDDDDDEEWR